MRLTLKKVSMTKLRPLDCAIEDEKLLTEDQDLRRERYSGNEKGPEK